MREVCASSGHGRAGAGHLHAASSMPPRRRPQGSPLVTLNLRAGADEEGEEGWVSGRVHGHARAGARERAPADCAGPAPPRLHGSTLCAARARLPIPPRRGGWIAEIPLQRSVAAPNSGPCLQAARAPAHHLTVPVALAAAMVSSLNDLRGTAEEGAGVMRPMSA